MNKKQYQFLNENRYKYNTLKITGQTIRHRIKVQALKYTS